MGESLEPVIKLLNEGVFVPHANTFLWMTAIEKGLHIGPLQNLLLAIPGLFSRDVELLHFYVSGYAVAGVLLFAALCTRVFERPIAIAAAVTLYGLALAVAHDMVYAVHTSLMPPFTVGYMACLWVLARKGNDWAIVGAWALLGCAAQTHLMSAPLFFGVLAAAPPLTRRRLGLHFLGGLTVLAMHGYLLYEMWTYRHGILGGDRGQPGLELSFAARLLGHLREAPTEFVMIYGLPATLFGLPLVAACFWPRTRPGGALGRFAVVCGVTILGHFALTLALMGARSNLFFSHYLYGSIPAVILVCGIFVESPPAPERWASRLSLGLGVGLSLYAWLELFRVLTSNWAPGPRPRYYDFMRLGPQLEIAARLETIIRDEELHDLRIHAFIYDSARGLERCEPRWEGTHAYEPLVAYRAPDIGKRVALHRNSHLVVDIVPVDVVNAAEAKMISRPLEFSRSRMLDEFEAGPLQVRVHRAGRLETCAEWRGSAGAAVD